MDTDMDNSTENQSINARQSKQQRGRCQNTFLGKMGSSEPEKIRLVDQVRANSSQPLSDCHCLFLSFFYSCSFLTRDELFFNKIYLFLPTWLFYIHNIDFIIFLATYFIFMCFMFMCVFGVADKHLQPLDLNPASNAKTSV